VNFVKKVPVCETTCVKSDSIGSLSEVPPTTLLKEVASVSNFSACGAKIVSNYVITDFTLVISTCCRNG
jgi:hypothetical protein